MSSAVVFVLVCCVNAKKTLHKARLTALHAIWLYGALFSIALILYVLNQIKLVYYVKDK